MAKRKQFTFFILILVLFVSCWDDPMGKYDRPDWLEGKVYTQLKGMPELSTYTKCLELTGMDTIIDVSGSYTVFAPTNDAFVKYFQENGKYNSIEDIPLPELTRLVKYHIVQNPWTKSQLRSLDVYGWIDTLDISNDEPKGFKRETILMNDDIKVGTAYNQLAKRIIISDPVTSNLKRRIITDSRKFVPFYYNEYFNIYDLNSSDFEFYFNRSFENNEIYFANAKIIGDATFAENGFIYSVDQIVEPMKNGYEILSDSESSNSYSDFLELVNYFPQFTYNEEKTNNQAGADEGLAIDSLFDLSFPQLTFNVYNEKTKPPLGEFGLPSNVTIRYHHGLMAPTNAALNSFLAEYINGPLYWGNINNAPEHIKKIIVNTYMSVNPIYASDLQNGFYNGQNDVIKLDESNIIQKQFGSNCSFIGLNKAIVPRAFSSVTGPIYQQQGYSIAMYAIEKSGLLPALKRENQDYSLYMEDDENLRADSSLLYYPITGYFSVFQISEGGDVQQFTITPNNISELRMLILNQIGVEQPNGIARKEFIKNMAGNHLIVNNETGVVCGTSETSDGYRGGLVVDVVPRKISVNADNGTTYQVGDWFNFSATNLYSKISGSYPRFHQLLIDAGLALTKEYRYSFISESDFFTVFVPSDAAIDNFDRSGLTTAELRNILLLHFVQGDMIFTDGNKPSGYYETTRIDEKSTPFSTIYTKLKIKTGYDVIYLPAKDGSDNVTINESPTSNVITARSLGSGTEIFPVIVSNGVIHQVDKILRVEELDTK